MMGMLLKKVHLRFTNDKVYGFDSFEGLPENWRPGFEKGTFSLNGMLSFVFIYVLTSLLKLSI